MTSFKALSNNYAVQVEMQKALKSLFKELNLAWDKEPELLMSLGFTEDTMIMCEKALANIKD